MLAQGSQTRRDEDVTFPKVPQLWDGKTPSIMLIAYFLDFVGVVEPLLNLKNVPCQLDLDSHSSSSLRCCMTPGEFLDLSEPHIFHL